ncbi:MAG: hypothetical protein COV48_01375 [Elusimicrobia bacterium CG11_big_fil_rev_8_21_14_0_20_64_6]|nr:MAG: hypothetical protein COV48_01375 [Elusimicrobia bacterium CG11_big_fil_rev_8_21_14_0_20_64_6]
MNPLRQRIQARLKRYFITGFFTLIPAGLSVLVVWSFVSAVDRSLAPVLDAALGFHLPGLGLITATVLILSAGMLASHVVGERLLEFIEVILSHIPVFKWVYGPIKQMTEAFSPANKASFKSVVMVEFPRPGVYSLGFVTGETVLDLPGDVHKSLTSVFVPTNHVYIGDVIFVPTEHVIATPMNIQQGIQAVLSAGAVMPGRLGHTRNTKQ